MAASSSSNEQTLSRAKLKDWYNNTFFDIEKGIPKPSAEVAITLQSSEGEIVLPTMQMVPHFTIETIFMEIAQFLAKEGPFHYLPEQEEQPPISNEPIPANIEQIVYRKKEYILEHYIQEGQHEYVVKRVVDRKVMDETKKTRQHVINTYQKLFPDFF